MRKVGVKYKIKIILSEKESGRLKQRFVKGRQDFSLESIFEVQFVEMEKKLTKRTKKLLNR